MTNSGEELAMPEPAALTPKKIAAHSNVVLRPKRSANPPAMNAPTAHPSSMEATLNPLPISLAPKAFCSAVTVPLMQPLS